MTAAEPAAAAVPADSAAVPADSAAASLPAAAAESLSGAALPPRSRGVIGLLEENCTVCMLCARECPDWCIYIDSRKETVPAQTAGGQAGPGPGRVRNVLARFAIDFSLCMYCGICVEVCPYDALFWSPEFAYPAGEIGELTHERGRLREWMWTVPPPPAHDASAPPAREVLVAGSGGAAGATVAGAAGATVAQAEARGPAGPTGS